MLVKSWRYLMPSDRQCRVVDRLARKLEAMGRPVSVLRCDCAAEGCDCGGKPYFVEVACEVRCPAVVCPIRGPQFYSRVFAPSLPGGHARVKGYVNESIAYSNLYHAGTLQEHTVTIGGIPFLVTNPSAMFPQMHFPM